MPDVLPSFYLYAFFNLLGLGSFPQNTCNILLRRLIWNALHFLISATCHLPTLGSIRQYWFYITAVDLHLGLYAVYAGFPHLMQ